MMIKWIKWITTAESSYSQIFESKGMKWIALIWKELCLNYGVTVDKIVTEHNDIKKGYTGCLNNDNKGIYVYV